MLGSLAETARIWAGAVGHDQCLLAAGLGLAFAARQRADALHRAGLSAEAGAWAGQPGWRLQRVWAGASASARVVEQDRRGMEAGAGFQGVQRGQGIQDLARHPTLRFSPRSPGATRRGWRRWHRRARRRRRGSPPSTGKAQGKAQRAERVPGRSWAWHWPAETLERKTAGGPGPASQGSQDPGPATRCPA